MDSSDIHEAGAQRFKLRWLFANDTAAHAVSRCGVNCNTPKMRKLLALVVFHILETFFNPKSPNSREYWENKRSNAEFTDGGGI